MVSFAWILSALMMGSACLPHCTQVCVGLCFSIPASSSTYLPTYLPTFKLLFGLSLLPWIFDVNYHIQFRRSNEWCDAVVYCSPRDLCSLENALEEGAGTFSFTRINHNNNHRAKGPSRIIPSPRRWIRNIETSSHTLCTSMSIATRPRWSWLIPLLCVAGKSFYIHPGFIAKTVL